ncbi:MAG: N-6 DNA methylase, partial [Acetobacteraceae bacterium]|nr:N-6 DNA methylase [Acetobacteraceae bacterium]
EDWRTRIRGRIDTLFGAVVFEWKHDLAAERGDVDRRLPDYLAEVERDVGRRALGIAGDGALFIAFQRDDAGGLIELGRHAPRPDQAEAFLQWLDAAIAVQDDLRPEPAIIRNELGRESLAYRGAVRALAAMWAAMRTHPEAALKRGLWEAQLREAYGADVGSDALFVQHTYLTVLAKTIAARVLDVPADNPADLLSGRALAEIGIAGAVESDFFDWVLHAEGGPDLVRRLARQTARFRLHDVQADVLKALYESLIDPAERHELGEYYTPDWLAARVVADVIDAPLVMRVLDPACGSGTFLFHALRRLMEAADRAGWDRARALRAAMAQVRGIDVHPVAVIFARVTWLLAIADRVADRPPAFVIPVFLGDALQWNLRSLAGTRDLSVEVPGAPPLSVPVGFAEQQAAFDHGLSEFDALLPRSDGRAAFLALLRRNPAIAPGDAEGMAQVFAQVQDLYAAGRNGIWAFVLRNLLRPLWLSRPDQRADVVIGNPPWVAFRHLSPALQGRVRDASRARKLWAGGKLATQQDLSALFFARAVELYLKPGGTIAFVMPYAALNRPAFAGLRGGDFASASCRFVAAMAFDEDVQPLFPVPASVLVARREAAGPLPATVIAFKGSLPRRDASAGEARAALREACVPWPRGPEFRESFYRKLFRNGATVFPRRFFVVEKVAAPGRLGQSAAAPLVEGRTSGLDKRPWRDLAPPRGPVEAEMLRPLHLGETLLPFRLLEPLTAVIPVRMQGTRAEVMDAAAAARAGYPRVAEWLRSVERDWARHSERNPAGTLKMTLLRRLDFNSALSVQFPAKGRRVIYAASGTHCASAVLEDGDAICEHKLYWAPVTTPHEAEYLVAILNSEAVRARIQHMQSRGQWGARDFDKVVWELPIPKFDRRNATHTALAEAGARAASLAATVRLPAQHFTRARRAVREALAEAGIAREIDTLVARLLDQPAAP